jgi:hypothetical protein
MKLALFQEQTTTDVRTNEQKALSAIEQASREKDKIQ